MSDTTEQLRKRAEFFIDLAGQWVDKAEKLQGAGQDDLAQAYIASSLQAIELSLRLDERAKHQQEDATP